MTVQTEVSRSGPYAGAGTTGPFTVGFRFLADSHLRVIRTGALGIDTDLSLGTDYTVTGAGDDTGTVTLIVALPVGASLTIIRDVPFIQEADYVDNDAFPAESHEAALDLLTMQTQQIKEVQDRALALPPTADASVSTELPSPAANNIIGWNASGDGLQNLDPAGLAGIISYGSYAVDVFDGDGVRTDFTLTGSALVSANCDVVVDGVSQTPGINFDYVPSTQSIMFLTGAPPVGIDNVSVRYGSALSAGVATAVDGQTATGTELIKAVDAAAALSAIGAISVSGDNLAGALNDKRTTVALTATLSPIWTVGTGKIIDGTGTPTITAFPAAPQEGAKREIYPETGATIVNGGNISVQGNANHTALAGDKWIVTAVTTSTVYVEVVKKTPLRINSAYASYTANADLSVIIPIDDSIPQITEGTQILSVVLSPIFSNSRVRIRFQGTASTSVTAGVIVAIFVNGGANAIAATAVVTGGPNSPVICNLEIEVSPGSTSPQTYTVRVGSNSGVLRMNGRADSRYLGGVQATTIIAEEIFV